MYMCTDKYCQELVFQARPCALARQLCLIRLQQFRKQMVANSFQP